MGPLILIVALFALAWLFVVRPSRRRRDQHEAMQDSVEVGDEIITAGGIHALVRAIDEEQLRVEIAPSIVVTLDRRAVAAVAREVEVETELETGPEPAPEDGAARGFEAEPR